LDPKGPGTYIVVEKNSNKSWLKGKMGAGLFNLNSMRRLRGGERERDAWGEKEQLLKETMGMFGEKLQYSPLGRGEKVLKGGL